MTKSVRAIVSVVFALATATFFAAGCSSSASDGGYAADAGGDASGTQGCVGCACYPNGTCNVGAVCSAETCVADGCQSPGDCAPGDDCISGACVPAGCGDGIRAGSEQCDDGNVVNGDGCNRRCGLEQPADLEGGEPITGTPGANNLPVDLQACEDESHTARFAPGDDLTVTVCAISLFDVSGNGLNKIEMVQAISEAQTYFDAAGAGIKLNAATDRVVATEDNLQRTDPSSTKEVESLMTSVRSRFDASNPEQCDAIVAFVNTVSNDGVLNGGQASWPDKPEHVAVVPTGPGTNLGWTVAHELGHVFGLKHTHEPMGGDQCGDTPQDLGCFKTANGCDATCATAIPPAKNVMSYYRCYSPTPQALTACQVNRARCFASKMFPAAACPAPMLRQPLDGAVVAVGQNLTFEWQLGQSNVDHTLTVTCAGSTVFQENVGTSVAKTIPGATFTAAGACLWTVSYSGACCPAGGCTAVSRTLDVQQITCPGAATQGCGNCGTQTRTCNGDGTWTAFGSCEGEGECAKNTTETCSSDGTTIRTCTSTCQWSPATCPGCASHASQKCSGNALYWYTSCGTQEGIASTCTCGCAANATACNPPSGPYTTCSGSTQTNYDACGAPTTTSCGACGCSGNTCKSPSSPYTTCSGSTQSNYDSCGTRTTTSCGACGCSGNACASAPTSYWSPSSDSASDSTGQQYNTTIAVSLTVSVRETGSGLEFQVCKGSGTFSEDIYISMYDIAGGAAYRSTKLSTRGARCSAWVGLLNSTGYASAQFFGAAWTVVSPDTSHSQWSGNGSCTPQTNATGTCWNNATDISLKRTCL